MGLFSKFAIAVSVCLIMQVQADDDRFVAARQRMVAEIEATVTDTRGATDKARLSPEVLAALGKVPRHEFVPDKLEAAAYANRPLPVGHG